MTSPTFQKIIKHPDREEIISKLLIGQSPADIHSWLKSKYIISNESKFVITESALKKFCDNYLDIYNLIQEDFGKTRTALAKGTEEDLELTIRKMPEYKDLVMKTVGKELDLKQKIATLCDMIETRMAQVFDSLQQDPDNMNTRVDRVLIEYSNTFGAMLEKAYKIIHEGPDQIIQHQVQIQHFDNYTSVFYEAIKRTLAKMDVDSSLKFIEYYTEEMSKLKDPTTVQHITPVEERLAQVQVINQTINDKIHQLEPTNV